MTRATEKRTPASYLHMRQSYSNAMPYTYPFRSYNEKKDKKYETG